MNNQIIKLIDRFKFFNKLKTWEMIRKNYILGNKNRKSLKTSIKK